MAARSLSVWYTVRSEIVGIDVVTAAYTDSAVGCVCSSWSTPKIACRWGVTFRPPTRNSWGSSAGDFPPTTLSTASAYSQPLLITGHGEKVAGTPQRASTEP